MESFNLQKFLIENKLTPNSRLLNEELEPIRTFHFGHDEYNIKQVQDYLLNHYNVTSNQPGLVRLENGVTPDCKIWFEHNQIMGALDIYNPVVLEDGEMKHLIGACIDVYSDDELEFDTDHRSEFDTHKDTLGHFDDDGIETYISEPYFTSEDFENAEDDDDLLYMKEYNQDQAEVYNTVKNGRVLWNFDSKKIDIGVFKKMVEKYHTEGKTFYYVYCQPGEQIGLVEITPQEAVEAVGAFSHPRVSKLPDRLPFGFEFEIYAV